MVVPYNFLGPAVSAGGSANTVVLPAAAVIPARTTKSNLLVYKQETHSVSVTVFEYDQTTAVDMSGETLVVVFETEDGDDVAAIASGDITIAGDDNNVVTFDLPAAATSDERVIEYAIRRAGGNKYVFARGQVHIQSCPSVDS
jgi:hypothetical protein